MTNEIQYKIRNYKNKTRKGRYLEIKMQNPYTQKRKWETALWKVETDAILKIKKKLAKQYLTEILKIFKKEGARPTRQEKAQLMRIILQDLQKQTIKTIKLTKEPKRKEITKDMLIKEVIIERYLRQLSLGNSINHTAIVQAYLELLDKATKGMKPKDAKDYITKYTKKLNWKPLAKSMYYIITIRGQIIISKGRKAPLKTKSNMENLIIIKWNNMTLDQVVKELIHYKGAQLNYNHENQKFFIKNGRKIKTLNKREAKGEVNTKTAIIKEIKILIGLVKEWTQTA